MTTCHNITNKAWMSQNLSFGDISVPAHQAILMPSRDVSHLFVN